jgi:RNA polymerase sigma factor (sigma-70 family)
MSIPTKTSGEEHVLVCARRQLVNRHAPRIGRSDAEDLASEAVTRALEHPPPDGRQAPWLEVIFRRLLCDHHRRRARARRGAAALATTTSCGPTPEAMLLAEERRRRLVQALATVPPDQRAALAARFWPEAGTEDNAEPPPEAAGGVRAVTLRTRVHRALARLRAPRGPLAGLRALLPVWGSAGGTATQALGPALVVALYAAASGPLVLPAAPLPVQLAQAPRPPAAARARPPADPQPAPAPLPSAPTAPAPRAAPARPATAPTPRPAGAIRFDFEDDDVTGDLHNPGDFVVIGPPGRPGHASLIEIPSSFLPAVAKMIEEL